MKKVTEEEKAFWKKVNRAYATLKADPTAWEQELEERQEWDVTLTDKLEDE